MNDSPHGRNRYLLLPLTWPSVLYGLWQRRRPPWWSLSGAVLGLVAALGLGIGSYGLWVSQHPRVTLSRLEQALTVPPVPQSTIMMSLLRWTDCVRSIPGDTKAMGDCWDWVKDLRPSRPGSTSSRSMQRNWHGHSSGECG